VDVEVMGKCEIGNFEIERFLNFRFHNSLEPNQNSNSIPTEGRIGNIL
jgi:hypothetical protein